MQGQRGVRGVPPPPPPSLSRAALSRVLLCVVRASQGPPPTMSAPSGKMKMRMKGATAKDAAAEGAAAPLPPAVRGNEVVVRLPVSYGARAKYVWEDVVAGGRLLLAEKINMNAFNMKTSDGTPLYRVPYASMHRWHRDDDEVMREQGKRGMPGSPHWLVELEVRRRKSLPLPGRPTVLGAAEDVLALEMGRAAAKNQPYADEEVAQMLLETAISLQLVDPVTKKPYTLLSNIRSLAEGFKERCKKAGICFVLCNGRKLSRQRYFNANPETLTEYANLVNPQLREFQDRVGKLTLEDVGNWDESAIDLCDYAEQGIFWCMKAFGNAVLVPYEQSPHFTLITGFAGKGRLVAMLIKIGSEYVAPHPYHCQLLQSNWTVVIAQSPNGWVDKRLKAAFFKLQVECPHNQIGVKPTVINCDGHDSNTRNVEMRDDAIAADVFMMCPPSHTSAATHGGTQQCDLGARVGGPIARFKAIFRQLMRKQHRAAMETKARTVTFAEIAALVEKALLESFDPSLVIGMNEEVGYYISEDGYLQCDPARLMIKPADAARAEEPAPAAAPVAARSSRTRRREEVQKQQDLTAAALAKKQKEIHAALGVVAAAKVAPVAVPTMAVPRPNKKSLNVHGCVITSKTHGQQIAVDKQAVEDADAKKADKENEFWQRHRPAVRNAEAALEEAGGTPSKIKGQKLLDALIVSRTGHLPKAKNNNVASGDTEGARLKEARAALTLSKETLCPPTPGGKDAEEEEIRRTERGADTDGEQGGTAGGSGTAFIGTQCHSCMAPINSIGDSDDSDARENDGMIWCNHCDVRLDHAADSP